MIFLKEIFEKSDFERKISRQKKASEMSLEAKSKNGLHLGLGVRRIKVFLNLIGLVFEGMEAHWGRSF